MAGAAGEGGGGGSRLPNNWQGLFRFCTDATRNEDTTRESTFVEMDPERKQWLKEVLESLAENDPVKAMLKDLQIMGEDSNDLDTKERALENLELHVQRLDLANDFHKIGGYTLLIGLLNSEHEGLQWRAGDLIATLVQNNPYCQNAALETGLVPALIQVLDSDASPLVKTKALYALSSLIRNFPEGQKSFIENDGFSVLVRTMLSGEERIIVKVAFLLRALCMEQPQYKDVLHDIGMVDELVSLLHQEHTSSHEHYMGALLFLVEDHPSNQEECRRPELKLHELLKSRAKLIKDKEEFQEELEHCQRLLVLLFEGQDAAGTLDR